VVPHKGTHRVKTAPIRLFHEEGKVRAFSNYLCTKRDTSALQVIQKVDESFMMPITGQFPDCAQHRWIMRLGSRGENVGVHGGGNPGQNRKAGKVHCPWKSRNRGVTSLIYPAMDPIGFDSRRTVENQDSLCGLAGKEREEPVVLGNMREDQSIFRFTGYKAGYGMIAGVGNAVLSAPEFFFQCVASHVEKPALQPSVAKGLMPRQGYRCRSRKTLP